MVLVSLSQLSRQVKKKTKKHTLFIWPFLIMLKRMQQAIYWSTPMQEIWFQIHWMLTLKREKKKGRPQSHCRHFLLNGHFNSQTQTNRRHWTPVSHRGHGASQSISHFFSIALQLRWSFSFLTASFFCCNRLYKQWRTQSYPSWPESSRFSLGIHVLSDRWISNAAAAVNQPKIDTEHAWGWGERQKRGNLIKYDMC